ncbi:Dyp-type peroxidase [Nonomuraea sp. NPDC049400]|uniref:Dyp-type peroxidase n=1 Tax=Nonomuraea sp. NPDC049400 TaxID=3364352 RepID=UPI0037993701
MTTPEEEPPLDGDEIQGNIVPGFLKPHMAVLALSLDRDDLARMRRWCHDIASKVTTLTTVMSTRRQVRALEHQRAEAKLSALSGQAEPGALGLRDVLGEVRDVWLSVAFSRPALQALLTDDQRDSVGAFTDPAFQLGMAARSTALGDPADPAEQGHHSKWAVCDPDILLVIGADDEGDLGGYLDELRRELAGHGFGVVYEELGHKLDAVGSEHFGFQDGVSQPGVRGRYGPDGDFLTPRYVADMAGQRPECWLYGLPGQYLVWPGEFVFGYPGQGSDPLLRGAERLPGPHWSRNGSYVAFRRLWQDVAAFRAFLEESARRLLPWEVTPEKIGADVVGRWPSGAPVARTPGEDIPELGVDRMRNDYFEFGSDARTLVLTDGETTDRDHPDADADPIGLTCPQFAHIRKVNSRTAANDAGGRMASFTRRILRRGLPYGPLYDQDPAADRGLLFLSYQSSIVDQFEFLNRQWMGDSANPRSPGGHDMLVGQNGQPGEHRLRQCAVPTAGGTTLAAARDFVIPAGGGYFFTPSITALREVLGAPATPA